MKTYLEKYENCIIDNPKNYTRKPLALPNTEFSSSPFPQGGTARLPVWKLILLLPPSLPHFAL